MPAGHTHILPGFCPADQKLTSPGLTRNKKAPRDSVGHVAAPFLAKGGASSARVGVLTDGLREPITVAGARPGLTRPPPPPASLKFSNRLCALPPDGQIARPRHEPTTRASPHRP